MSTQPKEFRIIAYDQERVNQAIRILTQYTGVDDKNQLEITIKPYKADRSKEQNRTLWWWYGIWSLSDPSSRTAGELHDYCKRKFLMPLLEAKDQLYRDRLEKLRDLYRAGEVERAESEFSAILWLSSTSSLNRTQMTSFMESVSQEAALLGVALPEPDKSKRHG